jgi:histidinol-phosphatase
MSEKGRSPAGGAGYGPAWSATLQNGSDEELDAWLAFSLGICDVTDGIAMNSFRTELELDVKADGSFVTAADRAIEHLIRERLADAYPEHGIVGEEYGARAADSTVRWYVDPIDGTHNFMRGVPLFGTLLAVERDGELQAGVISAPALGQRWYARRGGGAWVVGGPMQGRPRRLRVSTVDTIPTAQVLFRSVNDMHASRVSDGFDHLLLEVWRERGFGDFWGYTLVADGAAEAMMEQDLGPWDLAAPWLLIEEAGGRITDFDGQRTLTTGEGLATNGILHDAILARLWRRPSH